VNSANPRRVVLPAIRCTAEELAEIKRRAAAVKQTVSEFVRSRALAAKR